MCDPVEQNHGGRVALSRARRNGQLKTLLFQCDSTQLSFRYIGGKFLQQVSA